MAHQEFATVNLYGTNHDEQERFFSVDGFE